MTDYDRGLAAIYDDLITRYAELPPVKAIPMQAIRLYALRHSFETMIKLLLHKNYGVPYVAERCRREITARQEFCARMLTIFPPDHPSEMEQAAEEMAADLAAIDCPEGAMNLLLFLDRLVKRERVKAANTGEVH